LIFFPEGKQYPPPDLSSQADYWTTHELNGNSTPQSGAVMISSPPQPLPGRNSQKPQTANIRSQSKSKALIAMVIQEKRKLMHNLEHFKQTNPLIYSENAPDFPPCSLVPEEIEEIIEEAPAYIPMEINMEHTKARARSQTQLVEKLASSLSATLTDEEKGFLYSSVPSPKGHNVTQF